MGKALTIFVLVANLVLLTCQGQNIYEHDTSYNASTETEKPSYSFSYGVSDSHTGDIKTVWESKEGDTVKGHYSVVEPDGSMRTVEYSAGPDTGFQATVNNEGVQREVQGRSMIENKAMKDYDHVFDFSDDAEDEELYSRKYKKREHPEDRFRDYLYKKRPKYPIDQETSAYTHTYSIKHPYHDEATADSESYSHFGIKTDANCKNKNKAENNLYTSVADLDMGKQKYPTYLSNSFKDEFEKYEPQPTYDFEKVSPFKYTKGKLEDLSMKQPTKYSFPSMPDVSIPDKFYSEDIPTRPKKKYKPYKKPEYPIPSDDQDDYILVPKKKYKNPIRFSEANEFQPEMDDEYDRPLFNNDHDDDRYQRPIRGSGQKEIIRKVVKKKKPVINLLEIFDI